jgi:3-dehydroquinate synthase
MVGQTMDPLLRTVTINTGSQRYSVYIGERLLNEVGRICRQSSLSGRAAIVSDANVAAHYGQTTATAFANAGFKISTHVVAAGERSKSFTDVTTLCEDFARQGVDRQSFVVALGGGVVGDLAGFAAAIYYRGIPVVQMPTTIMAQVDSSVGGKTGINLAAGKNLVGSFHQPAAVLADVSTLSTLGRREWNEGFAEVIKYGVICERELLPRLKRPLSPLGALIQRCVEIKASFVEDDEREKKGRRALLNFGHTIGHAIENVAGYGTLFHGEAVALGMIAAAHISARCAGLPAEDLQEIESAIKHFELPTKLPSELSRRRVLEAVFADKKFAEGRIRFVVTPKLGTAALVDNITIKDLEFGLEAIEPSVS